MTRYLATAAAAVLAGALLTGGGVAAIGRGAASAAESRTLVPAPAVDEPRARVSGTETAILSGGCFWGVQAVFQHVKGVREVISGYTGGSAATAHYEVVSTGATGHAESVKIVYDPREITYGTLLRIYFFVATDPTELDYQGPDHGSQYRGEIWPVSRAQRRVAQAYLRQLTADHVFPRPIATRIDDAEPFYRAEDYHQNFATLHPDDPYIAMFDAPKVTALARGLPALYVARPALLAAAAR
ncbi:MAG TPA: peptide-methionine (S)-S-oxide reductase MsrA [Steroidobacteraceae bacterium]|nr:peptide-methionine (S)-S-oxide reductase MsrA [Steroidobacteraceae bacterium]